MHGVRPACGLVLFVVCFIADGQSGMFVPRRAYECFGLDSDV